MSTAKTSAEPVTIPYIGNTGRPFHRLPEAQRRWYTGKMTEEDANELVIYFASIEERVRQLQAERIDIRSRAAKELVFREDTSLEERQRKLEVVKGLTDDYQAKLDAILRMKATVLEYVPGEPLALPPVE